MRRGTVDVIRAYVFSNLDRGPNIVTLDILRAFEVDFLINVCKWTLVRVVLY